MTTYDAIDLACISWERVEAPTPWHPEAIGDTLVGFYLGQTTRTGRFGQYNVVLVLVPHVGAKILSGIQLIQRVDASGCRRGDPLKVTWTGEQSLRHARKLKTFEVYVQSGVRLKEESLPTLEGFTIFDGPESPAPYP